MADIIFNWIRGDDEIETLVFTTEQGDPMDFTDCRFDCDIVPNGRGERIRLSTTTGEITVNQNIMRRKSKPEKGCHQCKLI